MGIEGYSSNQSLKMAVEKFILKVACTIITLLAVCHARSLEATGKQGILLYYLLFKVKQVGNPNTFSYIQIFSLIVSRTNMKYFMASVDETTNCILSSHSTLQIEAPQT